MSLQASVRPVHRAQRVTAQRGTARRVMKTAEQLGLVAAQPATTRRPRYRPAHASRQWTQIRTQTLAALRLLLAPGPVYYSAATLAGVASGFLAGLWLL